MLWVDDLNGQNGNDGLKSGVFNARYDYAKLFPVGKLRKLGFRQITHLNSELAICSNGLLVSLPSNRRMQISSSHSGFNFSSVYRSVTTKHTQPTVEQAAPSTGSSYGDAASEQLRREALMLQSAYRASERAAETLTKTPDL